MRGSVTAALTEAAGATESRREAPDESRITGPVPTRMTAAHSLLHEMKRILLVVLALVAGCGPPTPGVPTAEEYAVWAVAIDSAVSNHRVAVRRETEDVFVINADETERLRQNPHLPREMVEEFLARNTHPAHVAVGRIAARKVSLIPRYRGPLGLAAELASEGDLRLSRAGFDASGRHALVGATFTCGGLCGNGALMLMERGRDGRWRVVEFVGEMYF